MPLPQVHSKAPDFSLPDQGGEPHKLSDYAGKWVLLYFYPKDDTPGCTKEACVIRDAWPEFVKLNAVVLGVSADKVASHGKFVTKYKLPFTILADIDKIVLNLYGVWGKKKFLGKSYEGINRVSFLVSPDGKIARVYEKVKPAVHAEEVLLDIGNLSR